MISGDLENVHARMAAGENGRDLSANQGANRGKLAKNTSASGCRRTPPVDLAAADEKETFLIALVSSKDEHI